MSANKLLGCLQVLVDGGALDSWKMDELSRVLDPNHDNRNILISLLKCGFKGFMQQNFNIPRMKALNIYTFCQWKMNACRMVDEAQFIAVGRKWHEMIMSAGRVVSQNQ